MTRTAVIGAGAWGTTLATLLAEKGHSVSLWVYEKDLAKEMAELRENKRYLPGFPLPESIEISANLAAADVYLFAVPTQFLRPIVKKCKSLVNSHAVAICASKGIEEKSLKLPLEILQDELKTKKTAVLSGPNLSVEIAQGLPAASVVASENITIAKFVQQHLMLERFRIYASTDPTGVQLGGALKNIIAIAAGVADGLKLGNNAKSGLMIRGFVEISRLGIALGAQPETFAGLSGMGDLITTCTSKLSRNHRVGEQLAQGKKLKDILSNMREVAEGIPTAKAALALAEKHQVDLPITQEVYEILYEGKDPYQAIASLMTRSAKQE